MDRRAGRLDTVCARCSTPRSTPAPKTTAKWSQYSADNEMKCSSFNDWFDNCYHIGSLNHISLHSLDKGWALGWNVDNRYIIHVRTRRCRRWLNTLHNAGKRVTTTAIVSCHWPGNIWCRWRGRSWQVRTTGWRQPAPCALVPAPAPPAAVTSRAGMSDSYYKDFPAAKKPEIFWIMKSFFWQFMGLSVQFNL